MNKKIKNKVTQDYIDSLNQSLADVKASNDDYIEFGNKKGVRFCAMQH